MAQRWPCLQKKSLSQFICFASTTWKFTFSLTLLLRLTTSIVCVLDDGRPAQVLTILNIILIQPQHTKKLLFLYALLFLELENKPNLKSFLIVCHCQRWPQARHSLIFQCTEKLKLVRYSLLLLLYLSQGIIWELKKNLKRGTMNTLSQNFASEREKQRRKVRAIHMEMGLGRRGGETGRSAREWICMWKLDELMSSFARRRWNGSFRFWIDQFIC